MIRTERAHLNIAVRTHPGMTGKLNEDCYAVSAYQVGRADARPSVIAIISDGIGGHRAGEVAAQIAVDTISHAIARSEADRPLETLGQAITAASQSIAAQAGVDPDRRGMGATCACVWVIGDQLYTSSVGDSRIYLLRRGELLRLTTDHTWIQEALEKGLIRPDQVRGHPNMHVIRRYLGSAQPPAPDTRLRLRQRETDSESVANQGMRLLPGDRLLLCSDGLTDLVGDEEMGEILATTVPESAVQALVDFANARGGHDNITVILLELPSRRLRRAAWKHWPWVAAGVSAGILLALAIFGIVWLAGMLDSPVEETPSPAPVPSDLFTVETPAGAAAPDTAPGIAGTPLPGSPELLNPTYTPWPTHSP